MKQLWCWVAITVAATACNGSSGAGPGQDATRAPDATPADALVNFCTLGATQCDGYDTQQTCVTTPTGTMWQSAPCAAPSACVDHACAASCADECTLGTSRTSPMPETCQLWDVSTRAPTAPGTSLADRARQYDAYLRTWGMPAGQVTYMEFTDEARQTIAAYADQPDSAIFTGTYLAAQAMRYKATRSPDALANVTALVQTMHMMWNVAGSGSPGWLARFAAPSTSDPVILQSSFSSTDPNDHFNAMWNGQAYDWKGHISRDQYQGVLIGFSNAYDVLTDESVRDLIRADLVTFVTELMKTRKLCPQINGAICLFPLNVQYCVLTDQEPLSINVVNGLDTLTGVQEFMPSLFGLYPQPAAAIQLTSAFEIALQVTANQPAWATQHATIQAFFDANVDSWLTVAKGWTYNKNCGTSYYANNITFTPMFDLARLDTDPARSQTIRSIVLEQQMWQKGVINDKNAWFAYIYAANAPAGSAGIAPAIAMANAQLAQFTAAPRVHVPVSNNLPADPSCPGESATTLDVSQRVINDFEWHRGSWQLSDAGNLKEVYPGVDYLIAYWIARSSGFLADDAPTECTRWLPTP